ncbi:MAG: malonic semialdehyde reductase [Vicinamibacterales bacterium]
MNHATLALADRVTDRRLDDAALDVLFREARTHNAWSTDAVPLARLRDIYELMKWGPTSVNGNPARLVFLTSDRAKARLLPALMPRNVDKTRTAPVVVIVAYDTAFHQQLPHLLPHAVDAPAMFANNPELTRETAERNSALQGAYFMLAARALGLDCGPMSGFDAAAVNREFFPDGRWKVNFLCNLGYGDPSGLFPRSPRLDFETACRVI